LPELTSDRAPRLLPVMLAATLGLWAFSTAGFQLIYNIFVNGMLGEAFDSQAEHFLRGNVDVDGEAIRHEAMIVDGKARMYFGPFPALLRIPLNFIYPAGRGKWSLMSVCSAATIALFAFGQLVAASLRSSLLSPRAQTWLGSAAIAGLAFASPLSLLVGEASIYNEAIIWGFAWALAALSFAWQCGDTDELAQATRLLGFSLCAVAALLSRVTFGLPLILIVAVMIVRLRDGATTYRIAALVFPVAAGVIFFLALSYARFGTFAGINYDNYINPLHREFVHEHGIFNLQRVPFNFLDYFNPRFPSVEKHPPFLTAGRYFFDNTPYSSLPFSETYLPVPWCSAWLVFGAVIGLACLFRPSCANWFERSVATAFLLQCFIILSYFTIAQRYATDLYPFLIVCFLVFLRAGGKTLLYTRHVLIALIALSIFANTLTTLSWLVDADQNTPLETRQVWKTVLRR
jgi:hypothetical protein